MWTVYNCDISVLIHVIWLKNQQLLSIDRKILSLKDELFDMLHTYIISFSRKDFDKLNYTYTFYLHKFKTDFNMEMFKKYFYLWLKDKNALLKKVENKTFEWFNLELKKLYISDKMFDSEDIFNNFIKEMNIVIEKETDLYKIGEALLYYIVNIKTEQILFYTGSMEENIKILKKKSAEKIDKTLWNRFLHLTLYWKEDTSFDI